MFKHLTIQNPKRSRESNIGRASWYPYYAGFSLNFAHSLVASSNLHSDARIIDPWNGSGTTTAAATALGYCTYGFDLNPVMVIAAKARTLCRREKPSLWPITIDLIDKSVHDDSAINIKNDPLCTWLFPNTASIIRKLEISLQRLLVTNSEYQSIVVCENIGDISDLAAFFYTALFRTARVILKIFFASNPTWVKKPKKKSDRFQLELEKILNIFKFQVQTMIAAIDNDPLNNTALNKEININIASSDSLPISNNSVDFVLTSQPYCTRIDYAVATMPELAILGYEQKGSFLDLRRKLIGTSTVPVTISNPLPEWGPTCNQFLKKLESHKSKASRSYYYKNHVQYFDAIYRSISELHRSLKTNGGCVLVVQDSYYKEVHNNLPQIFIEMADNNSLQLMRRVDFKQTRTMAGINPAVRKYRNISSVTESVLCFINN